MYRAGEDADFRSYKVVGNGVTADETTYNSRNTLGWGDWCITKNCKDPVAAMQFCNFMASEEGQYLTLWGVEGEHWDYVDGKHQPRQEVLDSYRADEVACSRETGIRRYRMFVKNGTGKDGTPYDLVTKWSLHQIAVCLPGQQRIQICMITLIMQGWNRQAVRRKADCPEGCGYL